MSTTLQFLVDVSTDNGLVRFRVNQPDSDRAEARVLDLLKRYSKSRTNTVVGVWEAA